MPHSTWHTHTQKTYIHIHKYTHTNTFTNLCIHKHIALAPLGWSDCIPTAPKFQVRKLAAESTPVVGRRAATQLPVLAVHVRMFLFPVSSTKENWLVRRQILDLSCLRAQGSAGPISAQGTVTFLCSHALTHLSRALLWPLFSCLLEDSGPSPPVLFAKIPPFLWQDLGNSMNSPFWNLPKNAQEFWKPCWQFSVLGPSISMHRARDAMMLRP